MKRLLSALSLGLLLGACTPANEPMSFVNLDSLEWQHKELSVDEYGAPETELTLVNTSDNSVLATTTCTGTVGPLESEGPLAVRCWWAGGGYDYNVVTPADAPVVVRRWVDEESGEGPWENI